MKLNTLLIIWLVLSSFAGGMAVQYQLIKPEVVYVPYEVTKEIVKVMPDEHLVSLMHYYQSELNNRGKDMMMLEDELTLLRFKVAWYKAITGQEIEVRIER